MVARHNFKWLKIEINQLIRIRVGDIVRVLDDRRVCLFVVDVCADCCQARLAAEAESQLDYQHTLLYIRRLTDSTTNLESADPNRQDADDPEFTQAPVSLIVIFFFQKC